MKKMLFNLIVLLLPVPIVFAQTCNTTNNIVTTPSIRFIQYADGTTLDTKTGLIWKRCAEGQTWLNSTCQGSSTSMNWQTALSTAKSTTFAGQNDWRIPNKKELNTLVERSCTSPAINLTVFPNAPNSWMWTSTSSVSTSTDHAWWVEFNWGGDGSVAKISPSATVRLVRGGQ